MNYLYLHDLEAATSRYAWRIVADSLKATPLQPRHQQRDVDTGRLDMTTAPGSALVWQATLIVAAQPTSGAFGRVRDLQRLWDAADALWMRLPQMTTMVRAHPVGDLSANVLTPVVQGPHGWHLAQITLMQEES